MGKRPAVIEREGMGMNIYDDGNGECNYAAYTRDFPGAQHSVSHLIRYELWNCSEVRESWTPKKMEYAL